MQWHPMMTRQPYRFPHTDGIFSSKWSQSSNNLLSLILLSFFLILERVRIWGYTLYCILLNVVSDVLWQTNDLVLLKS